MKETEALEGKIRNMISEVEIKTAELVGELRERKLKGRGEEYEGIVADVLCEWLDSMQSLEQEYQPSEWENVGPLMERFSMAIAPVRAITLKSAFRKFKEALISSRAKALPAMKMVAEGNEITSEQLEFFSTYIFHVLQVEKELVDLVVSFEELEVQVYNVPEQIWRDLEEELESLESLIESALKDLDETSIEIQVYIAPPFDVPIGCIPALN